ncbi:lytic transglycosylase domain-containing protein [Ancylobacter sp. TS-1]|uniref:lytic transglycosylase domain-containing protein n=1 Tax=Ancylobacter sp. TS-1 TaxID=1850374 RepID=UPI001265BAA1|nr:lytic transglycosylase domain-containing protein [Ancylobacter sp. TS-1]QFR33383.1 transglycosylase SLT domain-containing protein [Ancylobacter sp. TS-1]
MNASRLLGASLAIALISVSSANIASAKSIFEKHSDIDATSSSRSLSSPNSLAALVDREARANGVPVALARAVVRIESNWNARLTGRAGEVGLMQIKHQTARGVGYTGSRAALYEPANNIRYGMRYLAGAYRLAGGDTCGTVLRYQGGHGARRMSSAARSYCSKARTIMASN